ncbi:MAG: hypothetical protein J7L42_02730, partial [Elusimicrobia bacterium]|nr:hypothetical protein [Elusimicrobiota bacterium]
AWDLVLGIYLRRNVAADPWSAKKKYPLLFLPPFRGEIERGDLSTCQLFNLSTKRNVAGELPPHFSKKVRGICRPLVCCKGDRVTK